MRSRKTKKGCNITEPSIGIFEGRTETREYNQAILNVLQEQESLTAWGIAHALQRRLKPVKNKYEAESNTRSIYSVIQRKGGRLQELKKKHYIRFEGGRFRLEWKGFIALYIRKPELLESLEMDTYEEALDRMMKAKTPSDIEAPLGIRINGEAFLKDYRKVLTKLRSDPSYVRLMVNESKQLIERGIDLDIISNEDLVRLLGLREGVRKALGRLI